MSATMADRVREYGLRIQVSTGKRMLDADGWEHDAYRVKVTREHGKPPHLGQSLTLPFRMGTGHNGSPPSAELILDALASDASGTDQTFEDWAADYGLDPDSRAAERTYKACVKVRKDLERLLSAADYDALLYSTERL